MLQEIKLIGYHVYLRIFLIENLKLAQLNNTNLLNFTSFAYFLLTLCKKSIPEKYFREKYPYYIFKQILSGYYFYNE